MYKLVNSNASVDIEVSLAKDEAWDAALQNLQNALRFKENGLQFQLLFINNSLTRQLLLVRFIGNVNAINWAIDRLKRLPRYTRYDVT